MTTESKSELSWERLFRELALIEGIAKHAISPTDVQPPEAPVKKASGRKKTAPVAGDARVTNKDADDTKQAEQTDDRSTAFEREEKLFKAQIAKMESSIGTTLIPSSRDELIRAYENLRPAFDAIVELFRDRQQGVRYDERSKFYDSIHDLMQAAFRIGTQATVSTRAQRFVQRKVAVDSANSAREAREKNEKAKRRSQLDEAILEVSARSLNGKLSDSYEFAGLIIKEGGDLLGLNHNRKPHNQHTIHNHLKKLVGLGFRSKQTE